MNYNDYYQSIIIIIKEKKMKEEIINIVYQIMNTLKC